MVANGSASLNSAQGIGHEGSIFADDVVLHQSTPFRHHPLVPSTLCDPQNPMECGPFCPCPPGGACDSTLECQSGLTCVAGTCSDCGDGGCDGAPCTETEDCEQGLVCAGRTCHVLCDEHPQEPGCIPSGCANGVKDTGEVNVDCGGICPACRPGDPGDGCTEDSDCDGSLVCGTNNGGYFCGSRSERVCWPAQCQDGVEASECGTASSPCGPNCPGVVECGTPDPDHPSACPVGCPAGEQCKAGFGRVFNANSDDVCLPTGCPSNDPDKCGSAESLCGEQCVGTPDCSNASPTHPEDGNGGQCPHTCPDGEACCNEDIQCPVGSMCQAQEFGPGVCRPGICRYQRLTPPFCGIPGAICGDQCKSCEQACDGRQCGDDPRCGVSCGTCAAGSFCSGGQCLVDEEDPPISVPDGSGGEDEIPDLEDGPTAPVGAIAGQFSVSDQGTAQYNIPIDVPPGRAGMEPALSLRYAATKANGEAGVGWKIEGLSQITRCPRVNALDGYSAPIKNDTTDRFCIDGKRLELAPGSYQYGTDGAQYRTLVDTFTKVVSRTEGGDGFQHPLYSNTARVEREKQGPDYFQVWMKDGRILTYGRSLDSLVMARNGTRYTWLLNRVEDRAGNNIVIEYSNLQIDVPAANADGVPNAVVPKAIFYTGHGENRGTREVSFDYEHRVDPQLSYAQGGAPLAFRVKLQRITTKVHHAAVKNYRLEYEAGSSTQLKRVFECIGDSATTCKAPTEFQYKKESGFTQSDGVDTYHLRGAGSLDVDGDGRPDFMITTGHIGKVDANAGLTGAAIGADIAIGYASFAYLTPVGGLAVSAVWQLVRGPLFGLFAKKPKITFTTTLLKGTGDRNAPLTRTNNVQGLPCPTSTASFFLDYDQDGKDDVLSACSETSVNAALSSGTHFNALGSGVVAQLPWYSAPKPGEIYTPRTPVIYDVNGDSLQDIVSCADKSTVEVRLRRSPTEGFELPLQLVGESFRPPGQSTDLHASLPFCAEKVPTFQTFDVDGDGTPELLTRFTRDALERDSLALGWKSGWFALRFVAGATPSLSWERVRFTDTGPSEDAAGLVLADLNGDGLTDMWTDSGHDESGSLTQEATVWMNAGGRFIASTLPRPSPFSSPTIKGDIRNTALLDYDSDGRIDILEHWLKISPEDHANLVLKPDGFVASLAAKHPDDLVIHRTFPGSSSEVIYDGLFDAVGDLDADGNAMARSFRRNVPG